jgi:hypothetical protein
MQPSAQRRALLVEPVVSPPGSKQRLLHQILGIVHRPEHLVAVGQQFAPEGAGPLLELRADRHHHRAFHLADTYQHGARNSSPRLTS